MNIHLVALLRRTDFAVNVKSAVAAVGYRINPDDRVYLYTNLCLDTRDLSVVRSELACDIYLQPLPCNHQDALAVLPDLVTSNAALHADDANLLIDGIGLCRTSRTRIIPSISSAMKG